MVKFKIQVFLKLFVKYLFNIDFKNHVDVSTFFRQYDTKLPVLLIMYAC